MQIPMEMKTESVKNLEQGIDNLMDQQLELRKAPLLRGIQYRTRSNTS